ncbi:aldo/keto reductase [Oceanococcus atlanticus]|uniref:Protein tas n=1 Tax=Oceanococcus atlanticus TaxID=1317117 RepID=A0A1Y1SB20_9GAMM|nr:NADP(H)-dependent aldo-keto reductase [Oceanococcus atlanticus]ORE85252.1 aldo/keto reductase [Oceanococcus atlanticus]
MKYRPLGRTGLDVSLIGLGTMTWGEQNTQDQAFEQLDYAIDQGINFIDAAEMYPVPPKAETQGATERILGNWLKARGKRDDVILATKVLGRADWLPWVRGGPTLDRASVLAACDDSLRRLQTDVIDLYQVHWPDRETNFFGKLGYTAPTTDNSVPIEETLDALDSLVKAGKVRHIGVSNETPWGVAEYLRLARDNNKPRIASIQNPYSLLNRSYEIGLAEFADREAVGLLAYSPLGFGVLSGKYLDATPADARITLFPRFGRYTNPESIAATRAYVEIARDAGLDPAQMALAYINARPFTASNLIGATSMTQLRSNIASVSLELTDDVLNAIEAVHCSQPNPAP